MKVEFVFLENAEPGKLYLIPNIVRCRKCDSIMTPNNGWKCSECKTQWQFSDYASYFGMINFEPEPFVMRKLCDDCYKGDLQAQINHRIYAHDAQYSILQRTLRYKDHLLDIIPPNIR